MPVETKRNHTQQQPQNYTGKSLQSVGENSVISLQKFFIKKSFDLNSISYYKEYIQNREEFPFQA